MPGVITKAIAALEPPVVSDADDPNGSFHVLLSATTEDRDGDTLSIDQWELPLPDHITFDSDHLMSVAGTVGSGKPELTARGIEVHGTYSSIPEAQKVRTLVNEGHIRTTSVAFMTKKVGKGSGGKQVRELLNGAFVAVPSNREALVLSAKGVIKEGRRNSAQDLSNIQDAHDALVAAGAACDSSSKAAGGGRVGKKSIVGSVEALQDRVTDALEDTYGSRYGYWGWLRGVLPTPDGTGGTCIFQSSALGDEYDSATYQQAYTDAEGVVTLTGDAVEVDIHEIVTPDADASREADENGLTGIGDAKSAPAGDSQSAGGSEGLDDRARSLATRAARLEHTARSAALDYNERG